MIEMTMTTIEQKMVEKMKLAFQSSEANTTTA